MRRRNVVSCFSALLMAAAVLSAGTAAAEGVSYTPGTYTDTQPGLGGDVVVTVTTDETSITDIEITGENETPAIGGAAIDQLSGAILEAQSADIDGVAGATVTSDAVLKAASNALAQAAGEEKAAAELAMEDGTYTATTASYAEQYGLATTGSMTMDVTVEGNKITDINVTECTDTDVIGQTAFPILIDEVLESQSLNVDMVSGATVSSAAFMTALKDAITQAGGEASVDALMAVEVAKPEPVSASYDTDVLVIGAGMAGLTAAVEAANQGADVILLERHKVYSSSTTRSLGYVIGADTDVQKANGIEDSGEAFADDLFSLYKDEKEIDESMVRNMALHSGEQISWLEDQGVEFTGVIRKSEKGARSTPRIHTTAGGGTVTSVLVNKAEECGVNIMMGTPATDLIQDENGAVVGAKATNSNGDDITINAKFTIVAAGSYTNNEELFHELNPRIDNIGYACGCGDGDAYRWFKEVGADIINIEYTQFMYYSYAATFPEFPEVIPNSPDNPVYDILLVGGNAERLTAEDNFCFEFTKENWNLGYSEGYAVVDQEFMDTYPILCNDVLTATVPSSGLPFGYSGETAADIAEAVGLDGDTLTATVERYNELCDKGVLAPRRESSSGYRVYTLDDCYSLYHAKLYKNTGFSLKETADMIRNGSLDQILDAMEERRDQELAKMRLQERICARVSDMTSLLRRYQKEGTFYDVEDRPAFYRLYVRNFNWEHISTDAESDQFEKWNEMIPIDNASLLYDDQEALLSREKMLNVNIANIVEAEDMELCGFEKGGNVSYLKPVRCVKTIICGNSGMINRIDWLTDALDYMDAHGLALTGPVLTRMLMVTGQGDDRTRYDIAWFPIG